MKPLMISFNNTAQRGIANRPTGPVHQALVEGRPLVQRPLNHRGRPGGGGAGKLRGPWVATGAPSARRTGATLSEVLIALLIMSIGVISVATLFPLSVLRSVNATQLTHATLLKQNAEALILNYPSILQQAQYSTGTTTVSVFDPLGMQYATLPNGFGNDGGSALAAVTLRYHGGFSTQALAEGLVILPDSYDTVLTATGVTLASSPPLTSVDLPSTADLSGVPNGPLARVLLFDTTGALSESRNVASGGSGISGQTISWDTTRPLQYLNAGNIGSVKVQIQLRRYSWMATIRRDALGTCDVNVVVFFNRSFADTEEQIYFAPGAAGTLAFDPAQSVNHLTVDASTYTPFVKKGSFVFDFDNGLWYRIQSYTQTGTNIVCTLDKPPTAGGTRAVFMRGIVDVYPLGTRKP